MPPPGRGTRLKYDVDAVFRMVTAFEVAALKWPAQALDVFVLENWSAPAPLVQQGLGAVDHDPVQAPAEYAIIHPDPLATSAGRELEPWLEIASGELVAGWVLRGMVPTLHGHVVVDLVEIARRAAVFLRTGN